MNTQLDTFWWDEFTFLSKLWKHKKTSSFLSSLWICFFSLQTSTVPKRVLLVSCSLFFPLVISFKKMIKLFPRVNSSSDYSVLHWLNFQEHVCPFCISLTKPTRYGPCLQSTSYTQLVNAVTEDKPSGQCVFPYVTSSHQREQDGSLTSQWVGIPMLGQTGAPQLLPLRMFPTMGGRGCPHPCAPSALRRPLGVPAGLQSIITEDSRVIHLIRRQFGWQQPCIQINSL